MEEEYKKKYEELVKHIKHLHQSVNPEWKRTIESYVPEIKENEDEKIRKELIDFFKSREYNCSKRFIPWLEKQGHEGKKWIYEDVYLKEKEQVFQDGVDEVLENPQKYGLEKQGNVTPTEDELEALRIAAYEPTKNWSEKLQNLYEKLARCEQGEQKQTDKVEPKFKVGDWVVSPNGVYWYIYAIRDSRYQVSSNLGNCADWPLNTNIYHKFTIKDAKDGDVLYTSSTASHEIFIFKGLSKEGDIECYCSYDSEDKYCDGEYHFIGEPTFMTHPAKKEQRDFLFQKMKEAGYEWDAEKKELKKIEQKTTNKVIPKFKVGDIMRTRQEATDGFTDGMPVVVSIDEEYYHCTNELIAIKNQDNYEYPPINRRQKPTWSEGDEKMLDRLIKHFDWGSDDCYFDKKDCDEAQNWLKSLKERYIWKPSKEQIEALLKLREE